MLPEEHFKSLCRLQRPGARLVPAGRRGFGPERPSWARGALLGCLGKRPSHTQSCFPAKENTWGVGFRLQRPTAKQQGQGARGSPSPLFPTSSGSLGAKMACVAFLNKGAVGLVLLREECFLSLCRLQGPGTRLVPLGSWGLGADWPSFSRAVLLGHGRRRPMHIPSCFPVKENT